MPKQQAAVGQDALSSCAFARRIVGEHQGPVLKAVRHGAHDVVALRAMYASSPMKKRERKKELEPL